MKLENIIKKHIKTLVSEQSDNNISDDGTYMVLQNLMQMKEDIEKILSFKHQPNFPKFVTGEHAWAGDHITTSKDDIEEVANFISGQFKEKDLSEEKMKGEDPCWKGYEMVGKKIKKGKEVPNCVPKKK